MSNSINAIFMTFKQLFSSSIGKKFTMAFTGLFLVLYLIIHAGVNASIFLNDGGESFNTYAHFMSHNWIVRILEIGLFAGFIIHIIQGLIVWRQNAAARPVRYASNKPERNSTWYSRSMGLLGSLLLLFLVMHLAHFWFPTKVALYGQGDAEHNLFLQMKEIFTNPIWVVLYLIGLIALFWHLLHGFQSAWQTLGVNHRRYTPIIKTAGVVYSVLITVLFALMPLAFLFGWIG